MASAAFAVSLVLPWTQEWTKPPFMPGGRDSGLTVLFFDAAYESTVGIVLVAAVVTSATATLWGTRRSRYLAIAAATMATAICLGWYTWVIPTDTGRATGSDSAGHHLAWEIGTAPTFGFYLAAAAILTLLLTAHTRRPNRR